jgi:glycosyltransferase involved in cell wall biosynthesis
MPSPRVSILMGTHNRADFLPKTVGSIRAQSFTDWELIIADDGSIDSTPVVAGRLASQDARIVYIRTDHNQGISKNYNTGLRLARGEYIAMIDDDDPWLDPKKLEKEIAFLDSHSEYAGCGGGVVVIDAKEKELYRYLKPEKDEEIKKLMLFSNPMANSTTLFRRSLGEKVGWYDETIRYAGDRDFWLKMGLVGKLYNFPEYFSYYTMNGMNTSIAKIRPHLKTSFMVMRRYKGDYPGYPLAWFLNASQYAYSFLPASVRAIFHTLLARLKRRVLG